MGNVTMPEAAYLAMRDDLDHNSDYAAQDAAEALIAHGWPVLPPNATQPRWQIFDELLTTTELLAVASFVSIFPRAETPRQ